MRTSAVLGREVGRLTSLQWGTWLPVLVFMLGFVAGRQVPAARRVVGPVLWIAANVGLPLVIVGALSRVPLRAGDVLVPLLAPIIVVVSLVVALLAGRSLGLPRPTQASLANASGSINISFEYAFVAAAWGSEALGRLALFDVGNAIVNFTLLYVVVASMGGHQASLRRGLRRALAFPALWALAAALIINTQQLPVADGVLEVASQAGQWLLTPILLAMGLMLDVRHLISGPVLVAVALRSLLGLAIALGYVAWFAIDGPTRSVLLVAAAAPIGASTIAIAHREGLDVQFAAAAASLSALLAVIWLPLTLALSRP